MTQWQTVDAVADNLMQWQPVDAAAIAGAYVVVDS